MNSVIPVILSGGAGTRLWPLSRKFYPKQLLLPANGEHSLLQNTALRVKHLEKPIVVCNEEHRYMVAEQLLAIDVETAAIIIEPIGRNTAPAITVAALQAMKENDDAMLAIFPADHTIGDHAAFCRALETAVDVAKNDCLVTLGITPTRADSNFGYIQADLKSENVHSVINFIEKPDEKEAQEYIEKGNYFWNSGIFVFNAKTYLNVLEQFNQKIYQHCKMSIEEGSTQTGFVVLNKQAFESCPAASIDYAVLEKATNVMMVPMQAQWNDLGSWGAIWDNSLKDANNNVFNGEVISLNTTNTLSMSYKDKVMALVGLENIVVIDTKDALLVADKNNVNQIKEVVAQLSERNRSEYLLHSEVYRPWGSYESLDEGVRFQVKHLKVKPGASLSLQLHHHRAEHWIVVTGCAQIQIGEEESLLTENQSVYIPIGEKHRLTNPGKVLLELIEVQSGVYLEEDDITRFEDIYKRK